MIIYLFMTSPTNMKKDHVAIVNKKWHVIDNILAGKKTIESRWYKSRIAPWNRIQAGDTVYFKNSWEKVSACARVSKVLQFTLEDIGTTKHIVEEYGKAIHLQNRNYTEWVQGKKYCILIFLENPHTIEPFVIDKTGFGTAAAWLVVDDIQAIQRSS